MLVRGYEGLKVFLSILSCRWSCMSKHALCQELVSAALVVEKRIRLMQKATESK
jgi:hypothetical protein